MSKRHGARQQKRLAKHKAKRAEKRKKLARQTSNNPMLCLLGCHAWAIVGTWESDGLWEAGIGNLVIARRMPNGSIACGAFLVDAYCLGVKDAFFRLASESEFETLLDDFNERSPMHRVAPERLSKIVHCAADYAQGLGFAPHRDFRATRLLLGGIDPSRCRDELTFGHDGKPLYVAGPNDSPAKSRAIASQLQALGGPYLVALSERDFDSREFADHDEDCDDDEEDDSDVLDAQWR